MHREDQDSLHGEIRQTLLLLKYLVVMLLVPINTTLLAPTFLARVLFFLSNNNTGQASSLSHTSSYFPFLGAPRTSKSGVSGLTPCKGGQLISSYKIRPHILYMRCFNLVFCFFGDPFSHFLKRLQLPLFFNQSIVLAEQWWGIFFNTVAYKVPPSRSKVWFFFL